jgi:alkylation response protein AidB-like acyl-CoA dehydrogenase
VSELVLTEEQELLRRTAADFVQSHSPLTRVRQLRDSDDAVGYSVDLWRRMSALGWPGIILPEEHGGLGLGYAELILVLEELGAALAPEPFLSTVLLGANAILLGGSDERRAQILPRVASGEEILTLAHHEPLARHRIHRVMTTVERGPGGSLLLCGEKDLVLDGPSATRLVVSARSTGNAADADGIDLFLVDPASPGVSVRRQHLLDSRAAALVHLNNVAVTDADRIGAAGQGGPILDRVIDRALVGLSAEMLGGMRRAFELTVAYLREREQFGVKIGSFQALKHRAARMFVQVELARSAVMAAARAVDGDSPDLSRLAALAKAQLSDGFVHVANEAVQLHGGIGMTDEHDIGFFLKRARAAELTLGDAAHHRDRYASLEGY